MKKFFSLTFSLMIFCVIASSAFCQVREADIQRIVERIEANRVANLSYSNDAEQMRRDQESEMSSLANTEISGLYSARGFLVCNSKLDLSFFYGEKPEMDRLIAIYFLLTKEPFTPENFEPSSQIYIRAQGKVKTNISRSGNLEGVFFMTKLLEYSSDKEVIKKCRN